MFVRPSYSIAPGGHLLVLPMNATRCFTNFGDFMDFSDNYFACSLSRAWEQIGGFYRVPSVKYRVSLVKSSKTLGLWLMAFLTTLKRVIIYGVWDSYFPIR